MYALFSYELFILYIKILLNCHHMHCVYCTYQKREFCMLCTVFTDIRLRNVVIVLQ